MENIKNMDYNFKKILIIHPAGIGDLVAFSPVLKILKNNFPEAAIDVFVVYTPESKNILQEGKTVNRIFEFNWPKNNFLNKLKFFYQLRKEKYDLSITPTDLHPLKGKFFSILVGAKVRVGEERKEKKIKNKKGLFYTHSSLLCENKKKTENDIDLLRAIGLKIDYPLPDPFVEIGFKDQEFANDFLIKNNFENKILIGLHPGSDKNQKFKRWPKEYFIELNRKILHNFPNVVIFVFGGPAEKELCLEIKNESGRNVILISGWSLKQVAALIDRCKIFIASDTGLNHIASTTKTNLISIFGPSYPQRTGPLDRENMYIFKEKCRHPANLSTYPVNHNTHKKYDKERIHRCLKRITPERVFNKIEEILK